MRENRCRWYERLLGALLCGVMLLPLIVSSAFGADAGAVPPGSERLQPGERMYREGLLPSGEPMQAYVKGDLPVAGTAFTCVSCHLRSGLGSVEGGVVTPPTTGDKLYQPLQPSFKNIEQKYFPLPHRRPAYTDATLAEAIRSGDLPTGQRLNDVMPRYLVDDRDMALLISYLKGLSSTVSPGVTDTNISFATVITEDVPPEERDAMLAVLDRYVKIKNSQANANKTPTGARARLMAENMLGSREMALRTISLSRWLLKGPPETWRRQLEEYYRKEPVFALLGGITNTEWLPVHRFSEDHRIPCLFPITDFPVVSATDWYTLYFSKGYYQEGEAAARYLNTRAEAADGRPVVQIVRASREGEALSAGFLETWRDLGHPAPLTITLKEGEPLSAELVQRVTRREHPAALVLWGGSDAVAGMEALAGDRDRPALVLASSSCLGEAAWTLPEQVRGFTYLTYPFTFAQNVAVSAMGSKPVRNDGQTTLRRQDVVLTERAQRIATLSQSLTQVLTMALMDMRGNYFRDNFLDVIGMIPDQNVPLYERLSFGPGQRYASKGCYIVQLAPGPVPELVKKSAWVIH